MQLSTLGAAAQIGPPPASGGSASYLTPGTTGTVCGTAGDLLYSDGSLLKCAAGVTTSGGNLNVPAAAAYMYNGANVITASTTLGNYFFGGAGNLTMTDVNNTAIGVSALNRNTTGNNNAASGVNALVSSTTGASNTAIGVSALYYNTTGGNNTAIGVTALYSNTTGGSNTASGVNALHSNTTGGSNTASGVSALYEFNDTGSGSDFNSAFGYNTGRGIVTGVNNTILGANVAGLAAGLSDVVILATGEGTIRADFGKTTAAAWSMAFLAGTGSRPVCVTSAGTLEAGSLAGGLVTCP